ncbi:hypothetical protein I317_02414 [Kwoniella heveanensis CBS 569]|nr:hypothetical protein I317_02414 [Kwoniella heveanensis CBS 569]
MSSVTPRRPLAPLDPSSFRGECTFASNNVSCAPNQHNNDDDDDDDTSDEEGVFLGAHQAKELNLLSKLSSPSSTCSPSLSSSSLSPVPIIRRVKKRDSREFLRRKTLLLSVDRMPIKAKPIVAVDARRTTPSVLDSDSSEDERSPSLSSATPPSKGRQTCVEDSDLTLDFAAFHLSTPRADSPDSSSSEAGSDKENVVPVLRPTAPSEAENSPMITITQEQLALDLEDEIIQLDMGGLRLSDFSDPETGLEVREYGSPSPGLENEDDATPTESSDMSRESLDSPLPVARAGPVIIPIIPHHFGSASIRAESGSPCRPLPPAPLDPSMEPLASPPALSTSPSVPFATPTRAGALPPPDLVERGAKLLKSSTSISKPAAIPPIANNNKSASRVLAIRGQLNSAVTSRFSAMGAPQRSVSSSSGSSSGSASASAGAQARLPPRSKSAIQPPSSKLPAHKPAPPLAASTTQSLPRPALGTKRTVPAASKSTKIPSIPSLSKSATVKPSIPSSIPLKRPAPASVSTFAPPTSRPSVSTTTGPSVRPVIARSNLGQPSRMFQPPPPPQMMSVPVFSVGVAGEGYAPLRPSFRSPGKNNVKRGLLNQGTPRKFGSLGTPVRFGTPRQAPPSVPSLMHTLESASCSASAPAPAPTPASAPIHDVSAVPEPISEGPPASATRQATENASSPAPAPERGSSEDYENVSMLLSKPPSSAPPSPSPPSPTSKPSSHKSKTKKPSPKRASSRPKRAVKPPPKPASSSASNAASLLIAGISEKELKKTTDRNTAKNQVYHCAIDRQVVFQPGPRPPSPTSKIRTTAERDEEEKKAARGDRARRRKGEDNDSNDDDVAGGEQGAKGGKKEQKEQPLSWPIIEKMVVHKAPGDEEEFVSPPRPAKKVKTDRRGKDKAVKWDKGLTIIRDDGSVRASRERSREDSGKQQQQEPSKGCLKSNIELDQHGNVPDSSRPVENLKRTRIVVTAVFYDGEEPVPPKTQPAPASTGRSKKK